jgi:hypothetical protein
VQSSTFDKGAAGDEGVEKHRMLELIARPSRIGAATTQPELVVRTLRAIVSTNGAQLYIDWLVVTTVTN